MICMRVLTDAGVNEFRQFIAGIKGNPGIAKPDLNVEPYSTEFQPAVEIDENRTFSTKLDLAEYIKNRLDDAGISRESVFENLNEWTWIAYVWFEQLCEQKNGRLVPKEIPKYICSSDYRDYYRHFIAGPYNLYSIYGRALSTLFLHNPPYQHNDFIEQIASRQKIISHKNLVQVLHRLYLDEGSLLPKRGSQSRHRRGSLRRFIKLIDQLELTYNIYNMDANRITELLPDEFNEWINR